MLNDVDLRGLAGLAALALGMAALGAAWVWSRAGFALPSVAPGAGALRRVGPYVLSSPLGAGAMGAVYRARHVRSGQLRAVKLLPRGAGERERRQFEREIRYAGSVRHPNIVRIYEEGAVDGARFFVMELLEGCDLEQLVAREGPQPPRRVIEIMLQLCAALSATHAQGLVHRDVKPSNILLSRSPDGRDEIKLLDFGLAKHLAERVAVASVVGTPLYISPEAITSPEAVDGRSDLYALGAVAYYLLSGAPVFDGQSVVEVCSQHLSEAPEPLSRVVGWSIAEDLAALVLACLSKDRRARPASAQELARRLAACADAPAAPTLRGRGEQRARPTCLPRTSTEAVHDLALRAHEALV